MAELYLTLVSGRTVHVCSDWDGAAPTRIGTVDATGAPDDGEGIEAGEYYRDIFKNTTELRAGTGLNVAGGFPLVTESTFKASAAVVPTVFTGGGTDYQTPYLLHYPGGLSVRGTTDLLVSVSDEIDHKKPRTWQKVCTWLVFTGTAGTYHWRAASVDGWSSKAPID